MVMDVVRSRWHRRLHRISRSKRKKKKKLCRKKKRLADFMSASSTLLDKGNNYISNVKRKYSNETTNNLHWLSQYRKIKLLSYSSNITTNSCTSVQLSEHPRLKSSIRPGPISRFHYSGERTKGGNRFSLAGRRRDF